MNDYKSLNQNIDSLDFDNLDMSVFTDEEKKVVVTIKNILETEELEKYPIENILPKVKILLNNIYSNKLEVIEIFKKIIDLCQKHSIKLARDNRVIELGRIRDDFNNIIRFISKTSKDYVQISEMTQFVNDIELYYLPSANELVSDGDYDDTVIDDNLDNKIENYKNIINLWKSKMTEYYDNEKKDPNDIKENTNNLVFCITDDIDLSTDNYRTGFSTTVSDLENKSSRELKGFSGGGGLERIKKSTETGNTVDFTDYLKNKYKMQCHFVPYRYRSGNDNRIGLIKFEPSSTVKEHLEERYNLSKQSAYYGIFMIITAAGANHKQYGDFESYIMKNSLEIEEIANLFASDNPDYEKLDNLVDMMLNYKKEKMGLINENIKMI